MAEESLHEYSGVEEQSDDALLRDMERELSTLVDEFHVPGNKLRNLLEVVKMLYDVGEKRREELENLSYQMKELHAVLIAEREKGKSMQKKKIELEHTYDEDRARMELEKRNLEVSNVSLENKIEHLKKQIRDMESEAQNMADKVKQNEVTRQELLERYKREYEVQRSIKRSVIMESLRMAQRPDSSFNPHFRRPSATLQPHDVQTALTSLQEVYTEDNSPSLRPLESILASDVAWQSSVQGSIISAMLPGAMRERGPSLEDEIQNHSALSDIDPSASLIQLSGHYTVPQVAVISDPVEQYMDLLCGQDFGTNIAVTEKVETEMVKQENEALKEQNAGLAQDRQKLREDKEALQNQISELKIRITHLETSETKLLQGLQEAKCQRDELLEKESGDYCISTEDYYALLVKYHATRDELEKARANNNKLQRPLKKQSWFARIIEIINKIIEPETDEKTPPKLQLQMSSKQPPTPTTSRLAATSPLTQKLIFQNGWLVEEGSLFPVEQLPMWMEHVSLKSVLVERVDCVSMGRVSLLNYSAGQSRNVKASIYAPRWCAEVWVAVSDGEVTFIEVIDVLCKAKTDRMHCRFLVQNTRHIQCMKCIPGYVEPTPQRKASFNKATSRGLLELSLPKQQQGAKKSDSLVMWVITEDGRLCFYPTDGNRHIPIHSAQLNSRTFCLLHIGNKVLMGQPDSKIIVYSCSCDNVWDIHSPRKEVELTIPDGRDTRGCDVRCMAVVGNKVWIGCGPFIHVLNPEDLTIETAVHLGQTDKIPQEIIPVSCHTIVSMSKGSSLLVYDANSVTLVKTFDIAPMAFIYGNDAAKTDPVDVKSIATDGNNIFVGTSNGAMVVVLYKQLICPASSTNSQTESFMKQNSVPSRGHRDKIRNIIHVPLVLPAVSVGAEVQGHLPPHPAASLGAEVQGHLPPHPAVSLGAEVQGHLPPYRSLVISVGKGYTKHSEFAGEMEESGSTYTQTAGFEVMVWGHKIQ